MSSKLLIQFKMKLLLLLIVCIGLVAAKPFEFHLDPKDGSLGSVMNSLNPDPKQNPGRGYTFPGVVMNMAVPATNIFAKFW